MAKDAGVAADRVSFPLVVISHGASGSAPNYGWLTEYLARKGMRTYCRSEIARNDRGCEYGRELRELPPTPLEATETYQDPRIKAVVALDPAAGPGYSEASLAKVRVLVLVIGCEDNDFLPFEHHAGRYAALLPNASLIKLNGGEGHFVFLNSCTSDLSANGVPLCVDREGVDR